LSLRYFPQYDMPKGTQLEGTHVIRNQQFRSLIDWKVWVGVAKVANPHTSVHTIDKLRTGRWCR